MNLKLRAIHFVDVLEARLVRHRFYWLCDLIAGSAWWGDHDCAKAGCVPPRGEDE